MRVEALEAVEREGALGVVVTEVATVKAVAGMVWAAAVMALGVVATELVEVAMGAVAGRARAVGGEGGVVVATGEVRVREGWDENDVSPRLGRGCTPQVILLPTARSPYCEWRPFQSLHTSVPVTCDSGGCG